MLPLSKPIWDLSTESIQTGWTDLQFTGHTARLGGALWKPVPELIFNMGDDGVVWLESWGIAAYQNQCGKRGKERVWVPTRHFIKSFWLVWTGGWCRTRKWDKTKKVTKSSFLAFYPRCFHTMKEQISRNILLQNLNLTDKWPVG